MPFEPLRIMNSLGRSRSLSFDEKPLKIKAGGLRKGKRKPAGKQQKKP